MNKEFVTKHLETLRRQRDEAKLNLVSLEGAVQANELWIKELEKTEENS